MPVSSTLEQFYKLYLTIFYRIKSTKNSSSKNKYLPNSRIDLTNFFPARRKYEIYMLKHISSSRAFMGQKKTGFLFMLNQKSEFKSEVF